MTLLHGREDFRLGVRVGTLINGSVSSTVVVSVVPTKLLMTNPDAAILLAWENMTVCATNC